MQRLRQGNNRPELGGKRLSDAIEPHQHVIVQGFALVLPILSALARMSPPRSSALVTAVSLAGHELSISIR